MDFKYPIFAFWIGTIFFGSLDLIYQFLFTPTVEYIDIVGWMFAVTVMCALAGVMLIEKEEKENKISRISKLEKRVEKLEEKHSE